jgi:hypothetical protein
MNNQELFVWFRSDYTYFIMAQLRIALESKHILRGDPNSIFNPGKMGLELQENI